MVAATNRSDETALAYHGGGLAAARRLFPQAPEPWLDLSTGINAPPYPFAPVSAAAYARLPEAESIAALEAAAAQSFRLGRRCGDRRRAGHAGADPAAAAPAAGAKTVAILGFTYAEHERVWAASGAEVADLRKSRRTCPRRCGRRSSIRTIPTGGCVDAWQICARSRATWRAQGKSLIVDEAFIDFLPRETSLAPHAAAARR